MKGKALGLVAFLSIIHLHSFGASLLLPVRSFGFVESVTANPYAELIESTNGMLYGTAAGGSIDQGSVFQIQKDGGGFRVLKHFGQTANDGRRPFGALIESSDGALYGTTVTGGQSNLGTIFRLQKDGSGFTNLWHFHGTNGAYPEVRLLEAGDGKLYGTSSGGGSNDYGTVFRLNKDGSGFELLRMFGGTNGANPEAGLLLASDGFLYGTTYSGGASNLGAIYRLNLDGSGFAVLRSLVSGSGTNGFAPLGALTEGTNGVLFGTTSGGGTNGTGTLFSLNKDGSQFRIVHSFGGTNGQSPRAGLVLAGNGLLYGTTAAGGSSGRGVVFQLRQDGGGFTVLTNLVLAQGTTAALLEGADGRLYGTSPGGGDWGAGAVFGLSQSGSEFTVLASFHESGGDGLSAHASVTATSEGRLHGVTRLGGNFGGGTVFSIEPRKRDYQLHWSFDGSDGGSRPVAALLEAANGRLYGATEFGGINGAGMLFEIERNGAGFAPIHQFTSGTNGLFPRAPMVQHSNGNFYSSTMLGGSSTPGALYRLSPGGSNYTILKRFAASGAEGLDPMQALIVARDGQLYGTAPYGAFLTSPSYGGVFRFNPDTGAFTVLKNFTTVSQGAHPLSPLLEASDGRLYGTTYGGGTTNNAGVIFRIHTNGTGFQVLRSFTGMAGDGRHPCGRLVESEPGVLHGTTERGGSHDGGTLFRIGTDGSNFVSLASFIPATGAFPKGGLTVGPDGALYGTTDQGGGLGFGSVFRYGATDVINAFEVVGNTLQMSCTGIPGTNYWIERATNLSGVAAWTTLRATNASAEGSFTFADEILPFREAYYRFKR